MNKLKKSLRYLDTIKTKLSSPLPSKHLKRPAAYKAYLERELRIEETKIAAMRLEEKIK